MAEQERDFMETAVEEYLTGILGDEVHETETKSPGQTVGTDTTIITNEEAQVQQQEIQQQTQVVDPLAEFNKLTGLNFSSVDEVKSFAELWKKAPEIEEQAKILPELVDAVEKLQNPLNYFKDETAFKVAQIEKDPKYMGKGDVINEILRNDLEKVGDVKVIELAAKIKAREGVRNPLRAEIKSMGLDPDVVLDSYDDLDDDTKDLLKIKADQYRDELPKIGEGVKAPSFEGGVVGQILSQKKAAREDLDARMAKVMPVAQGIISEIKEMKMTDDFAFKLDLSPEQVKSYAEELSEILVSGQYDIGTEDGKKEIYAAIMDMYKADYFDKAVSALASFQKTKIEEEFRRRNNNEKPLSKEEPNPLSDTQEKDIITRAAELLVSRGY